jgi:hypothetical protein
MGDGKEAKPAKKQARVRDDMVREALMSVRKGAIEEDGDFEWKFECK